ncbi:hypothetical protein E4O00_11900 [Treponema sp. OMZ 788]|uniref:hypothetical protein n=1 Tax=Treponema sp. OMZ 788 TaxID=2563664 RepID=UPI0020A51171|nr:hypothetical protein [Treponema sp. OMZ 788]UTC64465.1 hypothetical protein E4O00_11900 [Treponema sp. OMZ 788]
MKYSLKIKLIILILMIMTTIGCSLFIHPVSVVVEGDKGIIVKEDTFRVKPGTKWAAAKKEAEKYIQLMPGYVFVEWKGMLSGSNEYTETLKDDMEIRVSPGYLWAVKAITKKE